MDVLGNGPSEELLMQWGVQYVGFLKGAKFLLATQRGPNMFSCFSTVKQKQKTKFYLLTKGAPFFRREGTQGAIAPRHPGPVRHWNMVMLRSCIKERYCNKLCKFGFIYIVANIKIIIYNIIMKYHEQSSERPIKLQKVNTNDK